jgi:hypothetical protein
LTVCGFVWLPQPTAKTLTQIAALRSARNTRIDLFSRVGVNTKELTASAPRCRAVSAALARRSKEEQRRSYELERLDCRR